MGFNEEKYRHEAQRMLLQIECARKEMGFHKPSIGYVGEHILLNALGKVLPKGFGICQGFLMRFDDNRQMLLSNQCDIIIYRKGRKGNAVYKSFGDIKIVNVLSAVIVIEVKSSISKQSFHTSMKAFEKMGKMGRINAFLFVFNCFSRRCLDNWLSSYRPSSNSLESVVDYIYDWSDLEWLPNSIISLKSESIYSLDYAPLENGDAIAYLSFSTADGCNKKISCLQEMFSIILNKLDNNQIETDQQRYSFDKGVFLFR